MLVWMFAARAEWHRGLIGELMMVRVRLPASGSPVMRQGRYPSALTLRPGTRFPSRGEWIEKRPSAAVPVRTLKQRPAAT